MDRHLIVILINFLTVFSGSSSDVLSDKYLGCFRNFTSQTLMTRMSVGNQSNQSMTIDNCINICKINNSTFAGLQGGKQCLCGEDFNVLVNEYNCTEECSGNSSQYCGGATGQSISVYSVCSIGYFGVGCDKVCHCNLQAPCRRLTGNCPRGCDNNWAGQACNITNASPTNPEWYIGCYGDGNPNAMDVKNPDKTTGYTTNTNSINYCLSICARFNYTYIGTQYWFDCNCGENYSRYGPSGGCTYQCTANSSQVCGGYFANSVYSVCPIGSFSLNCLSSCNCLNNTRCIYRNGTCPTGCKPGWTGNSCSIRDCSVADGNCDGPNEFCETVDLKYATTTRCGCNKGYTRTKPWNNCIDIDECLDIVSACGANAYNCTNTDGSFICGYCPVGLVFRNGTCIEPPKNTTSDVPVTNSQVGLIVGVVLGCFFAVVIIVIVGIFLYRRRSKQSKPIGSHRHTNNASDIEENTIQVQSAVTKSNGESESSYYNIDPKSSRIKVDSLLDVVRHLNENPGVLQKEFKSVQMSSGMTSDIGKKKELKKKNRFKNILPYDNNRVILSNVDNQIYSDYINASYIMGYRESDNLIASQAPTSSSVDDFWRMIFEKHVTVIVMMTNLQENGKQKCEKYWPDVGEILTFGDVTVSTVSEQKWQNFEQRSMLATGNSSRSEIIQWHYKSWPDHGVPQNVRSFLTFRRKVRNSMSSDSFTVIHCSAGAGRTGSYIAFDYLVEEAKTGYVDVLSCLKNLRQQRTQMIQTVEQYKFVYTALLEQFRTGDTVLQRDDYEKRLNELRIKNPNNGKTKLDTQFEMLGQQKRETKRNSVNTAVFEIQGTRPSVRYIVKPMLSSQKHEEFWKLRADYRSNVIVFINDSQDQSGPPFAPTKAEPLSLSNYNLILESSTEEKSVTVLKIKQIQQSVYANEADASEAQKVTLLNVHVPSSKNRDCVDSESISDAYVIVKSLSRTSNDPVIIVSLNDERLSGFCAAAFSAFDMITEENEVDVYQIVHDMRMSNSRFIPTLSSYEDLHHVIQQYFESTS